jgi:hypothetical protein
MERNTLQKGPGQAKVLEVGLPVKAATLVEAGNIGGLVGGQLVHADPATTTVIVVGRIEITADNTAGADGAKTTVVRRGCFLLDNDGTVTGADLFKEGFLTAQNRVGNSGTVKAGLILGLSTNPNGVWVEIGG